MSKTTTAFLEKLHAQPDGTFHWTEKYEKMLKDFDTSILFEKEYTLTNSWKTKELTSYRANSSETFLEDYLKLIADGIQTFNHETWQKLLHDLYQEPHFNKYVHYGTLSILSQVLSYSDILELMLAEIHADNVSDLLYPLNDMFVLLKQKTDDEKIKILNDAKRLIERYPSSAVRSVLFFLFPNDIPLSETDNSIALTYIDKGHYGRFFNYPNIFAHGYAHCYQGDLSEQHLLLSIQTHGTTVTQLIAESFSTYINYMMSYGDEFIIFAKKFHGKIRKNLRILDAYHHIDILDFLIKYAHEVEVANFIKNWVKRYPLFTLNHLIKNLPKLRYREQIDNVKAIINNALHENPLLIAPLKNNFEQEKQHLEVITHMTADITEADIQAALDAQINAQTESTAKKPKKKHTAKSNTGVKNNMLFPTVAVQQITSAERVNLDRIKGESYYDLDYYVTANKRSKELMDIVLADPQTHLYPRYASSDEALIASKNFAKWDESQQYLALFMIKPSVIQSEKYTQAHAGNYHFNIDDYANFSNKFVSTGGASRSYIDVSDTALKLLPDSLKLAIINGEIAIERLGYNGQYNVQYLYYLCVDVLSRQPMQAISGVTRLLPTFVAHKLVHVLPALGNFQTARHVLNYFNSKTNGHIARYYYQDFPDVILNEAVYLLFSKQDDPFLKKVKKNARGFFDWMLTHHKDALLTTLKTYDDQLISNGEATSPLLVPFANEYEAWKQQKAMQETQASAYATTELTAQATQLDDNGIPHSLLNDDWQKATRKRKIEIADAVNQYSLPILVIETTQQPLPKDAQTRVLKMLMLSDFNKPLPMLAETLRHMSHDSQTELADALWSEYLRLDMPSKEKWLMMASGFLYHESLNDKVWRFIKEWESWSTKRSSIKLSFAVLAQQAIEHPNTRAGDNALRMLIRISQKARATLRPPAQEQINHYAHIAGLSQDDLADKLIPTLGLDAQGKRGFDFGERQFTMTLDANLKPIFTDNNGKAFKNLPKAGKNDDADKAKQAHADLKNLKKQLKEFIRDDVPRMENMLITQRRMRFANFKAYYVNNPLMLRYSYQLVWGMFDTENSDKLIQPFRVVETGEILDINDDELTIADDALIGIVHPIQLTEEQRQQLSQSLQDDEIIQPFAQLARPIYQLTADEQKTGTITRFIDEKFATGSLIGFKNKGWEPYQIGGGFCEGYSKTVNGHELFFQFTGFGLWEGVPADDKGQTLEPIRLLQGMSDIDISEFIYVLDSMARL